MLISEICTIIEEFAPLALQENYDNAGLLIGDNNSIVTSALICIDVTEEVIDEAIRMGCNLIISHHPLIFRGLKKITGQNLVQRCVAIAIKNDIAIYAAHTNVDNVMMGVNGKIADKIGLKNRSILQPKSQVLLKLVCYVPVNHLSAVQKALFEAGAGQIGEYDCCSFSSPGIGTFRASENAKPYVGEINQLHAETESRFEVILPNYLKSKVISALLKAHPYEEVAYDLIPLANRWDSVGAGMIGELTEAIDEKLFLDLLKKQFLLSTLRHSPLTSKKIKRVALCGGSGSEFLSDAIAAQADVYVSADFKYHEFFETENKILIADIGHYESEQFTKDVFYELITKKIPNFAIRISEINTNPINYY